MKISKIKQINSAINSAISKKARNLYSHAIMTNEQIHFLAPQMVITIEHGLIFRDNSWNRATISDIFIDRSILMTILQNMICHTVNVYNSEILFQDLYGRDTKIKNQGIDPDVDKYAKNLICPKAFYGILYSKTIQSICDASNYTSNEEFRPALNNVFVSEDYIVGSDIHRLLFLKRPFKNIAGFNKEFQIPKRIIKFLKLFKDKPFLFLSKEDIHELEGDEIKIRWKETSSSSYPNWKSVIPEMKYQKELKSNPKAKNNRFKIWMPVKEMQEVVDAFDFDIKDDLVKKIRIEVSDPIVNFAFETEECKSELTYPIAIIEKQGLDNSARFSLKHKYFADAVKRSCDSNLMSIEFGDQNECIMFNDNLLVMPCH